MKESELGSVPSGTASMAQCVLCAPFTIICIIIFQFTSVRRTGKVIVLSTTNVMLVVLVSSTTILLISVLIFILVRK